MGIASVKFLQDLVNGLSTMTVLRLFSAVLTVAFVVILAAQLITKRKVQITTLIMLSVNLLTLALALTSKSTFDAHVLESRPVNGPTVLFLIYLFSHFTYIGFLSCSLSRFILSLISKKTSVSKPSKYVVIWLATMLFGSILMTATWVCVVSNLFGILISYRSLSWISVLTSGCNVLVAIFVRHFKADENFCNTYHDSAVPAFDDDDTILFKTINGSKSYFNLDMGDLSFNGLSIWELSCGSDQCKLSRGVAFLEYFHRVRISPECVEAAWPADNRSFPINKVMITLSTLHEACKRFAATNKTLRAIVEYEEALPEIKDEFDHLLEVRMDNIVGLHRLDELSTMEKNAINELDILYGKLPFNLPVKIVKNVIVKNNRNY